MSDESESGALKSIAVCASVMSDDSDTVGLVLLRIDGEERKLAPAAAIALSDALRESAKLANMMAATIKESVPQNPTGELN